MRASQPCPSHGVDHNPTIAMMVVGALTRDLLQLEPKALRAKTSHSSSRGQHGPVHGPNRECGRVRCYTATAGIRRLRPQAKGTINGYS